MATNAIEAYQYAYNTYTSGKSSGSDAEAQLGGASSQSEDNGSLKSRIRSQINSLLADVPQSGSKLTFQDIIDYRDQLREEFEARTKLDLAVLGVDTERDFTLSYDATTDAVTVDSSHPDSALINKYFEQNSEAREMFAQIVSYSNMLKPAERTVSAQDMLKEMQASAMSIWFEDNLPTGISGYGGLLFTDSDDSDSIPFFGLDMMI